MSNIQGPRQPSTHPTQDTPPKTRLRSQIVDIQPTERTPEQKQSLFEAKQRLRHDSVSTLPSQEKEESGEQGVDRSGSTELSQRSKGIPKVGELLKAKSELKPTKTVVKDGKEEAFETYRQEVSKDQRTIGQNVGKNRPIEESDLHSPELDRAVETYQTELGKMIPRSEQTLKNLLRAQFEGDLEKLSESDSGFGRKGKIDDIISQVRRAGKSRMEQLGTDDELSILLRQRSPEDLKRLCAEVVSELRSGKTLPYDKLSSKKQRYIDEMLQGIQEGLKTQKPGYTGTPTPLVMAQQNLRLRLEKHLLDLPQGLRGQVRLMSPEQLKTLLTSRFGANEPLMGSLVKGLPQILSEHAKLNKAPERTVEKVVKELQPEDLSGPGVKEALTALEQHPVAPKDLETAKRALTRHLQRHDVNHNTIWQLSLMSDDQIKSTLRKLTTAGDTELDALVQAVKQALPNQTGPLQKVMGKNAFGNDKEYEVPQSITIGKKTYQLEKFLAAAGNGAVFAYSNGNERVAVKLALSDDERDKVVTEINAHRELQGTDGSPCVIGLKGATSDVKGNLYIIQEFAGGGDVAKLSGKLQQGQDKGLISPQARQLMGLYVLKQALEGVKYMHDDRQMMHMDYKAENMMLSNDGQIKMIDFGTTREGTQQTYLRDDVDAVYNRAPERLHGHVKQVGQESETWSVGVMAYRLLVNNDVMEDKLYNYKFSYQTEESVKGFGTNTDNRIRPGGQKTNEDGEVEVGLGVGRVDRLVNTLMMPTPEQRVTPEQALQGDLLQDPRLNSPEMKKLFEKLANPPHTVGELDDEAKLKLLFDSIRPELKALGVA